VKTCFYKVFLHNKPHVLIKLGVSLSEKNEPAPSHELIPEHKLLSKEDASKILAEFKVSLLQIPKIQTKDPALADMNVKPGQVISVIRLDGSRYYRLVVEE